MVGVIAQGDDWPQWRGPNRDGQIRFAEPKTWPEKIEPRKP